MEACGTQHLSGLVSLCTLLTNNSRWMRSEECDFRRGYRADWTCCSRYEPLLRVGSAALRRGKIVNMRYEVVYTHVVREGGVARHVVRVAGQYFSVNHISRIFHEFAPSLLVFWKAGRFSTVGRKPR